MIRAIAGVHDPNAGEALRGAVVRALEPDGTAEAMQDGPLAIAWTGGSTSSRRIDGSAPLCLLDGHLTNSAAIAERVGLPPGQEPEQVLLAAYSRFGEAMFEQLRGDWVVLIWDAGRRRLLVARDQTNARPLFVRMAGERVLFASEVRNLLALLDRRPDPDRGAVGYWLNYSRLPPDRTLYAGVARVQAGHLLRIADGRATLRRYWTPTLGPRLQGSRQDLAEHLRAEIISSVERSCEPGVTAVMLSGGLDSTTLASVGARCLPPERAPVATYSMTFPMDPGSDESPQIDSTITELGLPNTRLAIQSSGILSGSLQYLDAWKLPPTAATLSYWLPLAQRVAEDGIKIILDGEDGDDLFGFSPWLAADLLRQGRPVAMLRLLRQIPQLADVPTRTLLTSAYRLGVKGSMPPVVHAALRRMRGQPDYVPSWLNDETARAFDETATPWHWKLRGQPRWWSGRLSTLLTGGFPGSLFDHARRRAALTGLDRRHPFADLDLLQFVDRLPPELAFDATFNRPLLRQSMAGIIPDRIRLQSRKMDLNTFVDASIAADLVVVRPLMLASDAALREYVRPESLQHVFDPGTVLTTTAAGRLGFRAWRLVEMECWLRSQEQPTFATDMLARTELPRPVYEFVHRAAPGPAATARAAPAAAV